MLCELMLMFMLSEGLLVHHGPVTRSLIKMAAKGMVVGWSPTMALGFPTDLTTLSTLTRVHFIVS